MRVKDISGMTWDELMAFSKQQALEREAEAMRNDPYQINRYGNDDGASCMHFDVDGVYVLYSDYIEKIERLKAIHLEELRKAYSMGRSDGVDSTVPSWRL